MNYKFAETSIPGNFALNVVNTYNLDFIPDYSDKIYKALFASVAGYLSHLKSKKSKKIALKCVTIKGEFYLGGIVTYVENEDDTIPGNWVFSLTFDEDDIKDIESVYDINDKEMEYFVDIISHKVASFRFISTSYWHNMFYAAILTLKQFLDANASETESVDIELPGFFTASVEVVDGVKVMSITPGDTIKQIIKDDAAL